MISNISLNRREHLIWIFLILIWSTIQLYLFSKLGVRTGWDSAFYLDSAFDLLDFTLPDGRGKWYFSYIIFLAGFLSLEMPQESVILFQILLSLIALFLLFLITISLTRKRSTGFITVFLYVIWIPIHEWNVFIYTESLFTSFLIISFYFLLHVKTIKAFFLFLPIFIYTVLIRPTGFAFFVAVLLFLIVKLTERGKLKALKTPLVTGLIFCSLILISIMLQNYELVDSYAKAEIIYPNLSLGILPPEDLVVPKDHELVIFEFLSFVYFNPLYFAKISMLKALLFFGNVKPYFSLFHNLYIIMFLFPVYILAFIGGKDLRGPIKLFFIAFIGVQGLTVMLTTENWDGRFLIPVLPFIFILASMGIKKLLLNCRFKYVKNLFTI